ncbi:DJ-1/PfpI family protein [Paenibacillus paridis]|uniref:DJ-1/PfpI family protein n=1 Tax=Paenibacillus paridis TaxID=2583376 RepID=UPI0011205016|nr:DJ-1/PfpI family protein [Paenibacillus paridis]
MLTVQIVLFDGFDLLDAIAPYEVFHAASMYVEDTLSVVLVTAEGPRHVTSGISGLKIEATEYLNPAAPGIILVPGAAGDVDGEGVNSIPAILSRAMNSPLTAVLEQALAQKDVVVATVCGGSLILAMGGLLEGRPAVTNHLGMDLLGATGAVPIRARVVDDGNLVTGGGVTSGLDVALYLAERELGPRIAHAVEQLFEYERRGTVWRETGMGLGHPKTGSRNRLENAGDTAVIPEKGLEKQTTAASMFDGNWDTTIATPVGKLEVKLSISTREGIIKGTAIQGDEAVDWINPVLENNKLAWSLRITKPMRLNLKFEVTVEGDHMSGIAKAGILPASKLVGNRTS